MYFLLNNPLRRRIFAKKDFGHGKKFLIKNILMQKFTLQYVESIYLDILNRSSIIGSEAIISI